MNKPWLPFLNTDRFFFFSFHHHQFAIDVVVIKLVWAISIPDSFALGDLTYRVPAPSKSERWFPSMLTTGKVCTLAYHVVECFFFFLVKMLLSVDHSYKHFYFIWFCWIFFFYRTNAILLHLSFIYSLALHLENTLDVYRTIKNNSLSCKR